MPEFVFTYRSPKGYTPSAESSEEWFSWFDGVAEHVVDMGRPVVDRRHVGTCDPETTQLGGYTVVAADDLEAAVVLAKGCPVLGHQGGIEIGLLGSVPDPGARTS